MHNPNHSTKIITNSNGIRWNSFSQLNEIQNTHKQNPLKNYVKTSRNTGPRAIMFQIAIGQLDFDIWMKHLTENFNVFEEVSLKVLVNWSIKYQNKQLANFIAESFGKTINSDNGIENFKIDLQNRLDKFKKRKDTGEARYFFLLDFIQKQTLVTGNSEPVKKSTGNRLGNYKNDLFEKKFCRLRPTTIMRKISEGKLDYNKWNFYLTMINSPYGGLSRRQQINLAIKFQNGKVLNNCLQLIQGSEKVLAHQVKLLNQSNLNFNSSIVFLNDFLIEFNKNSESERNINLNEVIPCAVLENEFQASIELFPNRVISPASIATIINNLGQTATVTEIENYIKLCSPTLDEQSIRGTSIIVKMLLEEEFVGKTNVRIDGASKYPQLPSPSTKIYTETKYFSSPIPYWGAKFKLLDQILGEFDYSKGNYFDLFCGGGSVFMNVINRYNNVIINDINSDLIGTHKNLFENTDEFVNSVKTVIPAKGQKQQYYNLRENYNKNNSSSKFYALILCSFSNVIVYNQKHEFKSGYGNRSWTMGTDNKINSFVENVRPFKDKLTFLSKDFEDVVIPKDSMCYFDNPYLNTDSGYTRGWHEEDEERLYKFILSLHNRKISFVLSGVLSHAGNENKLLKNLIRDGFSWKIIDCNYIRVSRNQLDKKIIEIIIKNY